MQSAATRLIAEGCPCHLIWDPVTGEIAQLISVLRAGCALGAAEHPGLGGITRPALADRTGDAPSVVLGAAARNVNREGRLCVQICVLSHPADPFTSGPLAGVAAIVNWLDSWNVPHRWPAGPPAEYRATEHPAPVPAAALARSTALWALGGHFGASQVPGCASRGPGRIDTDRLTGKHLIPAHHREPRYSPPPDVLCIPA